MTLLIPSTSNRVLFQELPEDTLLTTSISSVTRERISQVLPDSRVLQPQDYLGVYSQIQQYDFLYMFVGQQTLKRFYVMETERKGKPYIKLRDTDGSDEYNLRRDSIRSNGSVSLVNRKNRSPVLFSKFYAINTLSARTVSGKKTEQQGAESDSGFGLTVPVETEVLNRVGY